jgi:DNA-binding SARP family transcriptional activator/tetratricopeptide (TPR) repeat protein
MIGPKGRWGVQASFGMLGPLLVRCEGMVLRVPAARQRVVLGALAVRAGRVVPAADLAEIIWDGAPHAGTRAAVRGYVSRLRQVLGPAGARIVTRAPGYLLDAAPDEVDLVAFTRLCREGGAAARAGAWQRAGDLLGRALELWRGVPLADIPSRVLRDEQVPVLESLRLQAAEWRLEAGLQLGQDGGLVPELRALVREQPLRERFREQLMLALYRSGRQADALAVYQDIRHALGNELGVEPGPDLQELQRRILMADSALMRVPRAQAGAGLAGPAAEPEAAVPRQLPPGVRHFTGRRHELAALAGLLTEAGERGGAMVISAIDGTAGIGKTTLAVHWAHLVADRFPDGQLYVNLRGFDPSGTPVRPATVVRDFLQALGVGPDQIPVGQEAQAALYRTTVAGRRLLIVLDNARETDQVRPLLPGSAGCLVLVTSRARLADLAATDGAHLLTLDRPSEDEARVLLDGLAGAGLVAAEPRAAGQLIGLCARLPLALSIAAARATGRRRFPLAALAAELRDAAGRLDALDAGTAASSVRAVFSWSYQGLTAVSARLFRLLGLHPGPDISAQAAASLAGLPPAQARAALHELSQASLITEHGPDRYALHDLLRVYAAGEAAARDRDGQRRSAVQRMLDHYLRTADAADCAMDPLQDSLISGPPEQGVTPEPIAGRDQALTWFRAEHKVLLTVTGQAAQAGFGGHAEQLARTLVTFLDRGGHWHDLVASQQVALACSAQRDDLLGQAQAHRNLARARVRLGEYNLARADLRQAIELSVRAGDPVVEAQSRLTLSVVDQGEGRLSESLADSLRALELADAAGHPVLQAMACNNVGYVLVKLGEFGRALGYCRRALDLHGQTGPSSLEATIWDSLGYVHSHLGDYPQATRSYLRAISFFRDLGARYQCAKSLGHLGDAHLDAGATEAARDAWQQALAILCDLNHPDADQPRRKLRQLGQAVVPV